MPVPARHLTGDSLTSDEGFGKLKDIMYGMTARYRATNTPMRHLVTKKTIKRGGTVFRIPYESSVLQSSPTEEGIEIAGLQKVDFDSVDITTTKRVFTYRLTSEQLRDTVVNIAASGSRRLGIAQNRLYEVRLLQAPNVAGAQSIELAGNSPMSIEAAMDAERLLIDVDVEYGGQPESPACFVLSPIQMQDYATELGLKGQGASRDAIPSGLTQDILKGRPSWWRGNLLGLPTSLSVYPGKTVDGFTAPTQGYFFAKNAVYLVHIMEWDFKRFTAINFDGIGFRSIARFGTGVGPWQRHIVKVNARTTK